ncbi:MAG: HAD-IIA family hydrolase [Clostridia bacterium]|nr:HAD-IIA family hydrolase [Clostridia bacterium]
MVNDIKKALKEIKYFLLDMDGTIYIGDELIGKMNETLDILRKNGKSVIYLTNNSSKSKDKYIDKLKKLDLFREGDVVYTSGIAAADYLKSEFRGKKIYLLGTEALKKEFIEKGVTLVDDEQPDICVLAYDTELTYEKLCKFTKYIKKGACYIATHPDVNCPAPEVFVPDAGAFMALIECSTGLKPEKIIGKPYDGMGRELMNKYAAKGNNFVMVGDRLHTDIKFGNNCGFYTIFVLSGECTKEDLKKYDAHPSFILDSLNDIIKYL